MADQEKYADKIAKLLRKAEDPAATPAEAEAFIAKAQELMVQYQIDEALVAQARGENVVEREEIVKETIRCDGTYRQAHMQLAWRICLANDCRGVTSNGGNYIILNVIGFKSDVANVQLLNSSALIQAAGALNKWARDGGIEPWMSASQKYKERREFLFAFADGLGSKLNAAKKAGEKAAAGEQEKRADVSAAEASDAVALVVRSKKERVDDWMDHEYGSSLRTVRRNYSRGGRGARQAGREAGMNADIGGGKVGGGAAGALTA